MGLRQRLPGCRLDVLCFRYQQGWGPAHSAQRSELLVRGCLVPARDWRIEDTWHVAGLKATGSHDVVITDVVVPGGRFIRILWIPNSIDRPLYQEPMPLLLLLIPATFLGIATSALDEIVRVANTGRQQFRAATPMRDSELFQAEIGRIEADLECRPSLSSSSDRQPLEVMPLGRYAEIGAPQPKLPKHRPGSEPPVFELPMTLSHWEEATRSTRPRPCNIGCVIC